MFFFFVFNRASAATYASRTRDITVHDNDNDGAVNNVVEFNETVVHHWVPAPTTEDRRVYNAIVIGLRGKSVRKHVHNRGLKVICRYPLFPDGERIEFKNPVG